MPLRRLPDPGPVRQLGERLVRAGDVSWRAVPGGAVIVPRTDRAPLRLDAAGAEIWELLAEPVPFGTLVRGLADRHRREPASIEADVARVLADLRSRGAVQVVPAERPEP